jgi:hypothetical protein
VTDPTPDAETTLRDAATAIVAGVDRVIEPWVRAAGALILDAWGRLDPAARADADARVGSAARETRARVVDDLAALFATPVAEQRTTPLAIVRTAAAEVTAVLALVGIPEVERDAFEARVDPADVYGLAPRALADLGDPDLGGALLAWGVAKSRLLRAGA